ncbi:DUF418 domain-containing protein [Priestia aryabhattai]|uniref:DUF418 domain-containing protein n=1 Tax=Priestia aryabhattai TaxID=412384 RepID=UPI001C0B4E4E|nr:DUF418 domain-containing protein [Priestia aryabhattai]MBU3573966.1 DUF418 domain-containing protein [Priestia aryabhattai]WDL86933.1 DUF418 domain-containing protein [Priestia aryabhattai]
MNPSPLPLNERLVVLDIIRGIALLGIFLVNIPAFTSPIFIFQLYNVSYKYEGIDAYIDLFLQLFVQGKFFTIFSFLFGLGCGIFLHRAEEKQYFAAALWSRRMAALLVIGLFHLIFLWYGDILHVYAIGGFLLFFFYNRKAKTILLWAIGLLFFFYLLACMQFFIPAHVLHDVQSEYKFLHEHVFTQYLFTYRQADYLSWLFYRLNVEVMPMLLNLPFSIFPVFSMLLFGLYTAKKGLVHNIEQNHSFFKKIQLLTGAAGFTLTIILAMLKTEILRYEFYQQAAIHLFTSLSGIFLCFFYLTTLLLFLQFSPYASILVLFKYSGTMALTTYLSQTLICLCIVRVFDLYGSLTLTESTIICLVIYTLQLFFNKWWLYYFYYGPCEWLWRSFTYRSFPPLRRNRKASV